MRNPYAHMHVHEISTPFFSTPDMKHRISTNWCLENYTLRYFFVPDGRDRVELSSIMPKSFRNKDPWGELADYFVSQLQKMSGKPVPQCNGIFPFRAWLRSEMSQHGPIRAGLLDKRGVSRGNYAPWADELWQVYRVKMLAKYNLKKLPPEMDIAFGFKQPL